MSETYIFVTEDGDYVGMDNDSGGYPYINKNPLSAHPWSTVEDAKRYQKMFDSKWILKKLNGLDVSDVNPNTKQEEEE